MRPGKQTRLLTLLGFTLVLTLVVAPVASAKLIIGNKRDNKLAGTQKRDDVYGRDGRDVLIGFGGWDWLYGEEGDDILLGESGNDRLWGAGRDDTLDGGLGADQLWPGWGTDVVDAGPGNDAIWAGENDGAMDSIDCGDGFDRVVVNRSDRFFNCERFTRLRGQRVPGRVWIDYRGDDVWNNPVGQYRDILVGLGGDDYLNGHAFPDIIWGNEGIDGLDGDHGPDLLLGGPGNDTLWGNDGNDRLWGGLGLDLLYGDREMDDPGDGDDEIISIEADGEVDVIDCGGGIDRVVARPEDSLPPGSSCERVIRISR